MNGQQMSEQKLLHKTTNYWDFYQKHQQQQPQPNSWMLLIMMMMMGKRNEASRILNHIPDVTVTQLTVYNRLWFAHKPKFGFSFQHPIYGT